MMLVNDGMTPEDRACFDLGFRFAHALANAGFRARLKRAGWKSGMPIIPVVDEDDNELVRRRLHFRDDHWDAVLKVWSMGTLTDDEIRFQVYRMPEEEK